MSLDDRDSPPPRCVTARVEVDPADAEGLPRALRDAGAWLRAGKLVAFPTETVYGLGANALDEEAVRRVFEAKGRPAFNPLIVHVDSLERVGEVAREVPAQARELAATFWPGPLTIVLPRSAAVPDVVTGGLETVGVRMPAHPVARALLAEAQVPVAAPSANPFTQVSPTTAQHVLARLDGRIDAVIDGGPTDVGIESTVVAINGDGALVLLRHGGISREQLQQRGFVVVEASDDEGDGAARRSPGRVERHYAPGVLLTAVARAAAGRSTCRPLTRRSRCWPAGTRPAPRGPRPPRSCRSTWRGSRAASTRRCTGSLRAAARSPTSRRCPKTRRGAQSQTGCDAGLEAQA